MIWLLKWLFFGHIHKWKTIDKRPYRLSHGKKIADDVGTRYHQQCETCGIVVKRDLI